MSSSEQMLLEKIARGHPRLDPSKPIYERLPENSPLFARGLIEEAIANPQSMTPPGMEGFMSNMAQQQPAPQDAQASIKGKESTAGGGGKQKKKVIHVRR